MNTSTTKYRRYCRRGTESPEYGSAAALYTHQHQGERQRSKGTALWGCAQCAVLIYTILFWAVLRCFILNSSILCFSLQFLFVTVLYYTVLHYAVLTWCILCCYIRFYTLYFPILFYTFLHLTLLCCSVLLNTKLFYNVQYWNILKYNNPFIPYCYRLKYSLPNFSKIFILNCFKLFYSVLYRSVPNDCIVLFFTAKHLPMCIYRHHII